MMFDTLVSLVARLKPVHRACSEAEREAIYRFRYRIYVEELQREIGGVDHARRWVRDDDDDRDGTHHFYVGAQQAIEGAVRLRVWEPGAMPPAMARKLSMPLFGAAQSRLRTSEIGRFMIDPARRGAWVLPAMARRSYDFLAGEARADVAFCYCRPGLVDYYRRLGARQYGADLVDDPEGVEVPLVSVLSDAAHYRSVRAPQAHWVGRHFGAGRRAPVDTQDFEHLFGEGEKRVVTDGRAVWAQLRAALVAEGAGGTGFLTGLPEPTLRLLVRHGFVMDVPAGQLVTREGHAERELYIVLAGAVEVVQGARVLRRLGPGEVVGEIAFFHREGRRSASVRTLQASRIVTLRRRWLDDLGRSDPAAAQAILFNLGRTLAERATQAH